MYYGKIASGVGDVFIKADDTHLLEISFAQFVDYEECHNSIVELTISQLQEYFNDERTKFELPLKFEGSSFEVLVLKEMYKIPFGTISSYKGLAEAANSPKAYRAVGSVCNRNLYPIVVPCHRILKADHSLGGYAFGDEIKIKLLKLEGHFIKNNKVV